MGRTSSRPALTRTSWRGVGRTPSCMGFRRRRTGEERRRAGSGGFAGTCSLVERLRSNVSAIRPCDRSAVQEEALEVPGLPQRLEDRACQPLREIDRALDAVVEPQTNPIFATVLGADNRW